jgi:dynactin complex subunit
MLDMFKRTYEEKQPLEELQIPLEPEAPVQVIEAKETIEVNESQIEEPNGEEVTQRKYEENLTTLLETLKQEEDSLMSQKEQLVSVEEQLRLRTIEEIEKTKARISGLKAEIPELKQKCEAMAKALEIAVHSTPD